MASACLEHADGLLLGNIRNSAVPPSHLNSNIWIQPSRRVECYLDLVGFLCRWNGTGGVGGGAVKCGLFAIAFAVHLALGDDLAGLFSNDAFSTD